MNRRSRQQAKTSIEKDFFKLFNNANFGYDCRNNLNNYIFELICDKIEYISYSRKYSNMFDKLASSLLNSKIVKEENKNEFNEKLLKISDNDRSRDVKTNSLEIRRNEP